MIDERSRPRGRGGVLTAALAAASPLIFLIVAGWLYVASERSAELVSHTLEVKSATSDAIAMMLDAEVSKRGYIISHDPIYLAPYERAHLRIGVALDRLAALVAGNPEQMARVEAFRALANQHFEQLDATVALAREEREAEVVERVRSGASKRMMDALRADAATIMAIENALLNDRRANSARLRALAFIPVLLGAFALAILAWREMRARRRETETLRVESDLLNRIVAARTHELELERARVEALLRDVTHRVGNNLAMIAALLNIQRRRAEDPRVKDAIEEVASRIHAMAAGQRRLFLDIETDEVAGKPYLENLLDELRQSARDRGVSIESDLDDVRLPGKDAVSYIVLLNELITNALKHAFADGESGRIKVTLREELVNGAPHVRIEIEDDGRGLPADPAGGDAQGGGLGQKVVRSLLTSMRGVLSQEPASPGAARPGLRMILRAPRVSRPAMA